MKSPTGAGAGDVATLAERQLVEPAVPGLPAPEVPVPVVPLAVVPGPAWPEAVPPITVFAIAVPAAGVAAAAKGRTKGTPPLLLPLVADPAAAAPPEPPAPVEPEVPDEVCEAGPVAPDEPPLPVPAVLFDTGLEETDPLVPPTADAAVDDPPVGPETASPVAPAEDPPLDPPLELPEVAVAAGATGIAGSELD